ncbi:hypothetical protein BLA39750_00304 [Burkholderia lata]|uniref:Uncharacterized protein n=1 Tax=Burkholderia lata (strain ATCC 17760 / DSM 23089 / LMG 22485 / NCIMB 9086 / R18194 / 383) TaxID=482957 RepID=A0A6P2U6U9_BURL3|nr:hypothetical protein BLA39750_00304 [Burkholderia lata]
MRVGREVGSFWEVLSRKPVRIFVRAALLHLAYVTQAAPAKFNVFTHLLERTLLELNREPLPAEVTPGKVYRLS